MPGLGIVASRTGSLVEGPTQHTPVDSVSGKVSPKGRISMVAGNDASKAQTGPGCPPGTSWHLAARPGCGAYELQQGCGRNVATRWTGPGSCAPRRVEQVACGRGVIAEQPQPSSVPRTLLSARCAYQDPDAQRGEVNSQGHTASQSESQDRSGDHLAVDPGPPVQQVMSKK